MKRRVRKIANFFAFNLLFFALYLNFIHRDQVASQDVAPASAAVAFKGTVLVDNPSQYLSKTVDVTPAQAVSAIKPEEASAALKLSIN